LGIENLPGDGVTKEQPDEETPALIGQSPDVFNMPKDEKPEPINPLKEDDLLDDDPKREDGLL
jgi:hypothetical protein